MAFGVYIYIHARCVSPRLKFFAIVTYKSLIESLSLLLTLSQTFLYPLHRHAREPKNAVKVNFEIHKTHDYITRSRVYLY